MIAAVGAAATIVFALAYRALSVPILLASLKGTVAISAMILFIIVGATTFAQILSFSGASNGLSQAITGAGLAPWAVIVGMEQNRAPCRPDPVRTRQRAARRSRRVRCRIFPVAVRGMSAAAMKTTERGRL